MQQSLNACLEYQSLPKTFFLYSICFGEIVNNRLYGSHCITSHKVVSWGCQTMSSNQLA